MSCAFSAKFRRYLALWLPYLPSDRVRRQESLKKEKGRLSPEPDDRERPSNEGPPAPLVFVEKIKSALRLVAVSQEARALGLTPGLTLADARARVPILRALEADRAADARCLEQIADFCDRYTPLVALQAPDILILDITGCAHFFSDAEAGLHADLTGRLGRMGIEACAAIADTPDGARALACFGRHRTGDRISPQDRQAQAVTGLPPAALGIPPETVIALFRAGLKTIGDVAKQPRAALAARFGSDLVARLSRVLGDEDIRISPRRPLPAIAVEHNFAEPLTRTDAALEVLAGLAEQAARRLEERGEGGRRFEAAFHRSDGRVQWIGVQTGRPLRDPQALMRLFHERLDALADPLDPGFGFDLMRLSVLASEPFALAQSSLDAHTVADDAVAALVDRLSARFGAREVLRFMPIDTHVPERTARRVAAIASAQAAAAPEAGAKGGTAGGPRPPWRPSPASVPRPIHMFDPPQPIETTAEVPDGPPFQFTWRKARHRIVRAEGPERIASEWWRSADDLPPRDYYRIEDDCGRRFWVFREGLFGEAEPPPRWFLHGLFP